MPLDYYQNKQQVLTAKGQTVAQYYTPQNLDDLDITYGYMQNPLFGKSSYDRVEMHVYDLDNNLLLSNHDVDEWVLEQPKGDGTPKINLSFYKNLTDLGFTNGTFTTVYNFHRDAVGKSIGPKFKIHSISKDRKEVRVVPTDRIVEGEDLTPEVSDFYSRYDRLKSTSAVQGPYKSAAIPNNPLWTQLQLNFSANGIYTVTSWAIDDIFPPNPDEPHTILLKLLNPLPSGLGEKRKCWLVAEATQPIINKVLLDVPILRGANSLSGPNFDLCLDTTPRVESGFRSRDDLLGNDPDLRSEILNSYSSSAGGVRLNVDYTSFENYIRFSSAEKRINNFVGKLKLISGYDTQAKQYDYSDHDAQDVYILEYTGSLGTKYVKQYQKRWIDKKVKLINEFDDFEKWLYFESGSNSKYITSTGSRQGGNSDWSRSVITPYPKLSGSFKNDLWTEDYLNWNLDQLFDWAVHAVFLPGPNYELLNLTGSKVINWHSTAVASASLYDKQNPNLLRKTTPEFISDTGKDSNDTYLNFLDLTGQAHDIWWTYTKHFTDITSRNHNRNYENKNGVSDDLIYHIGKASGIDLVDGDPNQDLWTYRLGKTVDGKVHQNSPTGSIMTMTSKQRTAETWRRLVNNLPLILKTKGTSVGTRALINCYGIPESVLPIYEYGSSKKSEQSGLFETNNFSYCLNFNQSQSISTYWGPHDRTKGNVTASSITPNVVQFRVWPYTNPQEYSQSLWQVNNDVGIVLHRSHSSTLKPNGQPEGFTDFGHFKLILSSSIVTDDIKQGYYSASTQKAKIFDRENQKEEGEGWWTITVNRIASSINSNPFGTYHSSSRFNYELTAMRSEYGVIDQTVSASFEVSGGHGGTRWSSSLNDAWSGSLDVNNRSYFGGYITSSAVGDAYIGHHNNEVFGTPFSGSMQEVRYYARPLSQSVLKDHTLSPGMYSSNTSINTFGNLLARYKLSENVNHFSASKTNINASSSISIASVQPDQRTGSRNWGTTRFELRAEANNYPNAPSYGYSEEVYYTNTPEAGPNSYTSDKVRYEDNKLLRHLSPNSRAERPASDKYALDSNKLGIYFSPTDQVNKDIFDHLGGVPLDNFLGDPKEEFESNYSELRQLNLNYWKKYTNTPNKQAYLEQLKLYDMSLFTMLKKMLPARANADLGVVIEPHFIERAKLPSRGRITVLGGGTEPQNIASTPQQLVKFKNPTTIVNNKPQVKEIGFAITPPVIEAHIGKPSKPPTKIGTAPVVKKGTTKINISTRTEAPANSILRSFSATSQQTSLTGVTSFDGRGILKENSTTINAVVGSTDNPIIVLSNQNLKSVGKGLDRITQFNESNVVSHRGATVGSFHDQLSGTISVRSLRNTDGVTGTPYSHTSIITQSGSNNYITASTPTYKSEPTSSHICEYRKSTIRKTTKYFYKGNGSKKHTIQSASLGRELEDGRSFNKFAFSHSLVMAEVQDYNLDGPEGISRLRYKGAQLNAADFNIDSTETPDNGPVVSFTIGDPNNIISSDAGFGGNLSIE